MTLRGRSALITGASSGIGAATASALAAVGGRPVLVGRNEERLTEVARHTGGRVLVADLTDPADMDTVAAAGCDVDLLINNAGVGWAGELGSMTAEDVSSLMALNLTAAVQLTRAVLPAMAQRRRGHVVFVSSIATVGVREEAVYAASKAALRAFAASVRHEPDARHVGTTTVLPGAVRTPFFTGRGRPYDRRYPRQVSPEEVATALLRGVERGRTEVFVPRWLTVAARLHGAAPATFHRIAGRFG
ncbi:SDR family NAD(P)-dependent oxidoreductase [Haloactinomyces albus]